LWICHDVGITEEDGTVLAGEHKASRMYNITIKYDVDVISISPSMVVADGEQCVSCPFSMCGRCSFVCQEVVLSNL
jgi:hypothetical protein